MKPLKSNRIQNMKTENGKGNFKRNGEKEVMARRLDTEPKMKKK